MHIENSYRPHDPGHDYYAPGVYLITLVVRNRKKNHKLLGKLNDDARHPGVILTAIGEAVKEEWEKIPAFEAGKGRKVVVHTAVCMPDHFHGVLEVKAPMDKSVGQVIWGFKVACTKRWRRQSGEPRTAPDENHQPCALQQPSLAAVPDLHRMSKRQRAEYYAQHPEAQQPLFDDNYDDTICLRNADGSYDGRHFSAMVRYVDDNARRAIIRFLRPDFMRRCLHVKIAHRNDRGEVQWRSYAAFGNLFLLRWARKVQVFCHRKARMHHLTSEERLSAGYLGVYDDSIETRVRYEDTEAFREDCRQWKRLVMEGQTVIVTPGISGGEKAIKNRCLEKGYPLIHLQKAPIGSHWKPEESRFKACENGSLLILAPWEADRLGEVNGIPSAADYSIFHNLNTLAEELCQTEGEMVIVR